MARMREEWRLTEKEVIEFKENHVGNVSRHMCCAAYDRDVCMSNYMKHFECFPDDVLTPSRDYFNYPQCSSSDQGFMCRAYAGYVIEAIVFLVLIALAILIYYLIAHDKCPKMPSCGGGGGGGGGKGGGGSKKGGGGSSSSNKNAVSKEANDESNVAAESVEEPKKKKKKK